MSAVRKRFPRIAFDLDDVLCVRTVEGLTKDKYHSCEPVSSMIALCNEAYDLGYNVTVYTARGMDIFCRDKDMIINELFELTKQQLLLWNVKYHTLVMGKYPYDLLIDDKAICSHDVTKFKDIVAALRRTS